MEKLNLRPEQSGYQANHASGFVAVELDGGGERRRLDFLNSHPTVRVQYLCDIWQFDYFMSFYRLHTRYGANAFLTDLILDQASICEYTCWFAEDGAPEVIRVRGGTRRVRATLRIKPNIATDDVEESTRLFLYEQLAADTCANLGNEFNLWAGCLNDLVNVRPLKLKNDNP